MPTTRSSVTPAWPGSAQFTASVDSAVIMRNTDNDSDVFWAITESDTAPTFDVFLGHKVFAARNPRSEERTLILRSGDRLWIASAAGSFDITLTTGIA